MKTRCIVSSLATMLVLLASHSALGQVASAPPGTSYHSRLKAPRKAAGDARASDPALELRLTSRFANSKEMVRSLVRVAPHPDNRFLRVEVDSLNYYSSSDIQLDGAFAAQNHFFAWRSLPPGAYDVTVTVFGSDGPRSQRHAPFEVVGISGDGR